MKKLLHGCVVMGVLLGALVACKRGPKGNDTTEVESGDNLPAPANGFLADTGFRPSQHGYPFRNKGGKFPRTPPLVTSNVMVKLFGKDACIGGNTRSCKLTPPASEWAGMINRAMNGGQCEGMAVSSLTFFKGIDKANTLSPQAKSAHGLTHDKVAPLIGYYWAYQAVNPVMNETMRGRRRSTPASVEDRLVEMMKRGELATIGIWGPPGQGGHAVTPYAVEDKGNGIHWIRIYDNNYPDKERYIIIDRNANTWKYDLAAINPTVPKMPWGGGAESHTITVIPLDARLKKAECPFCRNSGKKTIMPRSSALGVSDQEGRKIGRDGDKWVNEIPDAEIVEMSAFLEGADAPDPIFVLPEENDYDITIGSRDKKPAAAADAPDEDDEPGVTIFGQGAAIAVEGVKLKANEKDTLSLPREGGGIRYKTGTGRMPALKMAVDDEKSGLTVRIGNMKADADDEVELKLDSKAGKLTLQGGGKSTESYDIKMKRVREDADDDEIEEKGVKFKLGESHAIDTAAKDKPKGAAATASPFNIKRGAMTMKPRLPKDKDAKDAKDTGKPGEADKGAGVVKPGLKIGNPAPSAKPAAPPAAPPKPGSLRLKKP